MFAPRYFAPTYFPSVFFPAGGSIPDGVTVDYFPGSHFAPTYFGPTYWTGTGVGQISDVPADPIEALCAWWASHSTVPTIAGGLWHGMAPRRTVLPFAVVTEVANVQTNTYSAGPDYMDTALQVAVFADGYREAKAAGLAVKAALDAALFSINGRGICGSYADVRSLELLPDVGPGGADVHRQIVEITMTWMP
jgi:hypothetical protein